MNETYQESKSPLRAQRFCLDLPIRYRANGETTWHDGRTENISRTGVLFRTERLVEVDTEIEMRFEMPVERDGKTTAEVACHGEIVRALPPALPDMPPRLAAKILDSRFVRGEKAVAG